MYVNGYRIGMLVTGSLALIAADHLPWHTVYLLLAVLFLIISPLTLLAPDPQERSFPPATLRQAVIEPFAEYFRRRSAIEVLVFLLLYKIDDAMALNLQTRFFLEMGFSKTDIGAVGKTFGLAATLFGVFVGGAAILRWGLRKCLWVFGLCQAAGTAGLAILSIAGKSVAMLTGAIVVDYFAAAMATAVILTFMARLTNKSFTATQYALLSSLAVVPRVILSAPTGYLAGHIGWSAYFLFCALAAVPALALLFRFDTWKEALS
jgi:PAT family beta-lactamase induction signal transducer AmpG